MPKVGKTKFSYKKKGGYASDAQRKAIHASKAEYKMGGGKMMSPKKMIMTTSRYYEDGGKVMTGRAELTAAQKNLPETLQKKILPSKKKKMKKDA